MVTTPKVEYRYSEVRVEGRSVIGTAMPYGERATVNGVSERFLPGSFGDLAKQDIILKLQHLRYRPLARTDGGGLVLTDSPEALMVAAEMPDTTDGNDALTMLAKRIIRGLSVEFKTLEERFEQGERLIVRAVLTDLRVG